MSTDSQNPRALARGAVNDTNTLAPCPFCGERAETDFIPEHHSYQIACSDSIGCTARITRDSELGAIEAWNCRAALAAPAQAVPAPGEPSEAPTQAQVDERSDTVWLFIRLGQKNIRRAITLWEIDSMRAPELAFGPLLLKAIAELRKT